MPKPARFALPILAGVALALVDHPAPQVVGVLLVVGTLLAPFVGVARREWAEGRPPANVRTARRPEKPGED